MADTSAVPGTGLAGIASASGSSLGTASLVPQPTSNWGPFSKHGLQMAAAAAAAAVMPEVRNEQELYRGGASDCGGSICAGPGESKSMQLVDLLESLEARVDLMSQMQHTRAAIQERQRAYETEVDYGPEDSYGVEEQAYWPPD